GASVTSHRRQGGLGNHVKRRELSGGFIRYEQFRKSERFKRCYPAFDTEAIRCRDERERLVRGHSASEAVKVGTSVCKCLDLGNSNLQQLGRGSRSRKRAINTDCNLTVGDREGSRPG